MPAHAEREPEPEAEGDAEPPRHRFMDSEFDSEYSVFSVSSCCLELQASARPSGETDRNAAATPTPVPHPTPTPAFTSSRWQTHVHDLYTAAMRTEMPQMEVRVANLSLSTHVAVPRHATPHPTLPTLPNTLHHALSSLARKKTTRTKHILRNVHGVFRPGTMTVVLGQPGAGKSALLQALGGRLPTQRKIKVEGDITFNGILQQDLQPRLAQMVGYVPQFEEHFPLLTVQETLAFAHACCGGGRPHRAERLFANGNASERNAALEAGDAMTQEYVDIAIQQLGLTTCKHTIVGDVMLRGISGGEAKRLSIGEMTCGDKTVLLLDGITTGLDSAAAFDIVKHYRTLATTFKKTIIMALLQPTPEIFTLFDNVLLLHDGYVVYHGPRNKATDYFKSLGFKCAPGHDPADFLLDLGTPQQRQHEVFRSKAKPHPRHGEAFADIFDTSPLQDDMLHALASPIDVQLLRDNQRYFDHIPAFVQSFWPSAWTLTKRQMRLAARNGVFIRSRMMMVVIMGLVYSTLFADLDLRRVQVVIGVLYASILFLAMGQSTRIPMIMSDRVRFYRQRGANFYRTSSYVVACAIAQIPMCVVETLVFGSMVYWICGFVNSILAFLVFQALILSTMLSLAAFFFFISVAGPNLSVVKSVSLVSILVFNLFSGFIISREQIPNYFVWIYWMDPPAWGIRALTVNLYSEPRFAVDVYEGINYMEFYGKKMGESSLEMYDMMAGNQWVLLGFCFLLGTYILFMVLSCVSLEYWRYDSSTEIITDANDTDDDRSDLTSTAGTDSSNGMCDRMVSPAYTSVAMGIDVLTTAQETHFVPVTVAFKDLWYSVVNPQKPGTNSVLIKGVSGVALPGRITALMGGSGAGKTTLLDVIAGRKTEGHIQGEVLLNGYQATDLALRRCTGYCEQQDVHSSGSTFREALLFSAFLRQNAEVPFTQKLQSVEECLELFELRPIADQIVRGSTAEQLKRLSIAVELAAQPSVLFLDEPTTGLDARSAKVIMDGVRCMANTGRTVICTIHQPSWEVFQLFDSLLLMKAVGQTVFFGELGQYGKKLTTYFENIPGTQHISASVNPASWVLDVIGAGVDSDRDERTDFAKIFEESSKNRALKEKLEERGVGRPALETPALEYLDKRAASNMTQIRLLLFRFLNLYWRTPAYCLTRLGITILLALLFGLTFSKVDFTSFDGINAGQGLLAMGVVFTGMIFFLTALPTLHEDRAAYYRERASETYNAFWYFLASTIAELPFVGLCGLIFTAILFPMVGFSGTTQFLLFWLGFSLHLLMQTYTGMFLVYAMPTLETAMVSGMFINSVFVLFMGFNPPANAIPNMYRWLYNITPQRFSLAILSSTVFCTCPNPMSTTLGCHALSNLPPEATALNITTVKDYTEFMYMTKHDELAYYIAYLGAWIVGLRVFGALALRFMNYQKK